MLSCQPTSFYRYWASQSKPAMWPTNEMTNNQYKRTEIWEDPNGKGRHYTEATTTKRFTENEAEGDLGTCEVLVTIEECLRN